MLQKRRFSSPLIRTTVLASTLGGVGLGCSDDGGGSEDAASETAAEGDGDGDASGDGDGDPATASGDGDGDSSASGDGDGEATDSGDGDGEATASGDGDGDPSTDSGDGDGEPEIVGKDYAQPGPYGVSVSQDSMQVGGCNLSYGVFEPDTLDSDIPLLLAHGFMRSIDDMAPTAEHIASWGVTVYTVPLCTNNFNIDHAGNGEAMAGLGEALAPEGAVYSGFSAGGLAAYVAAGAASNTVAYVGLDAVDSGDIGLGVGGLGAPTRGSVAEPGQCNTSNNFLPVYDLNPGAPVIRIVGAEHFDYETDACGFGDFACNLCAPAGPETRSLALGMTTAGVVLETGADLGGSTWWEPGGEYFDMFVAQDRIVLIP